MKSPSHSILLITKIHNFSRTPTFTVTAMQIPERERKIIRNSRLLKSSALHNHIVDMRAISMKN